MLYDDKFKEVFSEYFTELRKQRKMSRQTLSDFMGLPLSTFTCYEMGLRDCPLSVFKRLCAFYGIDYVDTFKMLDKEATARERKVHQ